MLHFQSEVKDLDSRVKGMTVSPRWRWLTKTLIFAEINCQLNKMLGRQNCQTKGKSGSNETVREKKTKLE